MNDYSKYDDGDTGDIADKLKELADLHQDLERQIELAEEDLVDLKMKLKSVGEVQIPDLLSNIRGDLRLPDGRTVSIKSKLLAHVSKDRMPKAVQWLDDHKYGNIVKREVAARLGRDDPKKAKAIVAAMKKLGVDPAVSMSIHHMTLTSFINEKMKEGVDIPKDLFGVQEVKSTEIK